MSPTSVLARIRRVLRQAVAPRTAVPLLLAVAAATVFLELADEIREGHATAVDEIISRWLRAHRLPLLDALMNAASFVGSYAFVAGVVAVVAWIAVGRRAYRAAGVLIAVAASSIALNGLLKVYFQRPRPGIFVDVVLPATYSFPSGHSMLAVAAYGTMAIVVGRLWPQSRALVLVLAPLLAASIGVSRIYLGVHWPSDVAAGFAAGALLLLAARLALRPRRAEPIAPA